MKDKIKELKHLFEHWQRAKNGWYTYGVAERAIKDFEFALDSDFLNILNELEKKLEEKSFSVSPYS